MGLFSFTKRKVKSSVRGFVQHHKEERAFRKDLHKKATQARRQAIAKEVLKQEKQTAIKRVSKAYNPPKQKPRPRRRSSPDAYGDFNPFR